MFWSREMVLYLSLVYLRLLEWRNIKTNFPKLTYLELLHKSHRNLPIEILPHCNRLEERCRALCRLAYNQCRGIKGTVREELKGQCERDNYKR